VKPIGHKTPQATSIIPCEMQTSEAYKCTNNLQQNFKREKRQLKNVNSQVKFRQRSRESKPS